MKDFARNSIILEDDVRYSDVINDVNTHKFANSYSMIGSGDCSVVTKARHVETWSSFMMYPRLVNVFHEKGQSCARFGIHEWGLTSRFDTVFSKLSKVSLKFARASLKVLVHKIRV